MFQNGLCEKGGSSWLFIFIVHLHEFIERQPDWIVNSMRSHFVDPITITVIKRRTAIILEGVSDGVFKSAN
jgi:hypothetical protein